MRKDPTEFRARFKAYKEGKMPYDAGRPAAIQEVDKSDADFAKRLRSNWRLEIWDWEGSGKAVTHKIGSSDNIVYPNVQTTEGGGLIDFTNPIWKGVVDPRQRAILNNDFVPMKTESDAIWFGPNYKKYYPGFKNGKLPKYRGGKIPYVASDGTLYNIDPNVVGSDLINITAPEVVVTGTDRRPMYQRYDAENSTYDPDAVRMFTDWTPIVGDISQGLDAYNAFKNNDYLLAGILGGAMLLPTAIEKPGKHLIRFGLNHFPELTKEIYDISRLYSKNVKDNPRLRKYANEVSDLLSSDKIRNRAFASEDMPNLMESSNIAKTPISFVHANRTFNRPTINLFGKEMLSPIPIPTSYAGVYIPDKSVFIKRQNRTPNQIRRTTYHEASHAADNGRFVPAFYDKMKVEDWVSDSTSRYLGLPTEKRARIISILTDAQHNGVDIDNPEEIANFLSGYDNKNYEDLLFYNLGENTGSVFLDTVNTLLKGFKNGKLPGYADGKIHIKPANRGKFTALKKRTGHSTSWFKAHGTPAQKKMAVFAMNAKKWKH